MEKSEKAYLNRSLLEKRKPIVITGNEKPIPKLSSKTRPLNVTSNSIFKA